MADMFGIQFYPTPEWLVDKMLGKVNWKDVTSVLEPSAGKGDIVKGIRRLMNSTQTMMYYYITQSTKYDSGWNRQRLRVFDSEQELYDYVIKEYDIKCSSLYDVEEYLDGISTSENKYYIESHKEIIKKPPEINCTVECVEIDPNLCAVLRETKCGKVINQDFLNYNCLIRYDCILMNPPFAQGEQHLLKALYLLKHGGQCVCILNAETLKNPCTNWRQELVRQLDSLNADIEYIDNAFKDSENTTNVEIALIYVNIPKEINEDLLKNLVQGDEYSNNYEEFNDTQLATDDVIGNLVKQYDIEAKLGMKVIDDFYSMQKYIPKHKDHEAPIINLVVYGCSDEDGKNDFILYNKNPINRYLRSLRDKYWQMLFMSREMSKLLTTESRTKYTQKLREFRDYDFTLSNIKQLQLDMARDLNGNIEDAILLQFDNLSYKYSLDKETNVHYFNGWKQNTGFCIRSKVIIPMYGLYNTRWQSYDVYSCREFLVELEKIFTYLDGGKTEGDGVDKILDTIKFNRDYSGEKIHFKYFDAELKKKGTVHIWFTNEELLKKFNIFGCQKHGWLPGCYGKKAYKNMTKEEQSVIDEFEGKASYEKVWADPNKYIGNGQMLQLM